MAYRHGVVPKLIPPPSPVSIGPGLTLCAPQSRRGHGPGIVVLVPDAARGFSIADGVPTPAMKWAEEGYCVIEALKEAVESKAFGETVKRVFDEEETCEDGAKGVACYDSTLWTKTTQQALSSFAGAIVYTDSSNLEPSPLIPTVYHLTGAESTSTLPRTPKATAHHYPTVKGEYAVPQTPHFDYSVEAVSHTRSLTFLKARMNGPYFDLEDIWDEHTYYEFENRSVENTMNTMVQEPYVNHVPTLTGGIGRSDLTDFYTNHFIYSNPPGTELELISRTIGIDRVVDEFIFQFTHSQEVDWLFPGVPPTNKFVEIPMMAVVNIRGDRLYHEHITWDQSTALRQIGYVAEYERVVKAEADGVNGVDEGREVRLPVTGKDTVRKMRDKNSVASNQMFGWGTRAVS